MSFKSTRVSRRLKNNRSEQKQKQPFFSKMSDTVQTKSENAFFQPKLTIGQPNDKYEKEADAVADSVVNKANTQPAIQQKKISSIQRTTLSTPMEDEKLGTAEERMKKDKLIQEKPDIQKMDHEEKDVQMKSETGGGNTASSQVSQKISSKAGKGQKLAPNVRVEMESGIGADFSQVNIHTDSDSVQMNKELGAQAFTHGNDVFFNEGKYDEGSNKGKRLLAHELTHVVQQGNENRIQKYSSFSSAKQSANTSLGWKHPSGTAIRVSDDGRMVVEDKGWNPNTNKKAWARVSDVDKTNIILKSAGSTIKLAQKPGTISGKAPQGSRKHTLTEIEPKSTTGATPFSLINDCGDAARKVMGSGTEDVAAMKNKGIERYTPGESYHGTNGGHPQTTPEVFFQNILQKEFGTGLTRTQLYGKYAALSLVAKNAFDKKYGINKFSKPQVGQAQTISSEFDMPGFATHPGMAADTWNFHYAATILRNGGDHVTLESAAGWGLTEWIFYMYGPAKKAQSFHEEQGNTQTHGTHFTTMTVQAEKLLKGKTSVEGVHFVKNPQKWDTTLIAKLSKGTKVDVLVIGRNWRKVQIMDGTHIGKKGWISNKFFGLR